MMIIVMMDKNKQILSRKEKQIDDFAVLINICK